MTRTTTLIITALALAATAISATELTESIKPDVRRGQEAAAFAYKPGAAFPGYALRLFRAEEQKHKKEPDAFKLGFAEFACVHMAETYQFALSLSRKDLEQAAAGWLFYSSRATTLQMQMHLTDAQMLQLFGAERFRYIQNLPGSVIPWR